MARPSFSEYWMKIAELTATRSTCDRAHVGCVLVRDNRQISAGYNGSITKQPHCCDVGCLVVNNHCVRTTHAEISSLITAARHGVSVLGCAAVITHFPCWNCFKSLLNAGISKIVFKQLYTNGMSREIYEAICACRSQVLIEDEGGMSIFHYTPKFENDVLMDLKLGA